MAVVVNGQGGGEYFRMVADYIHLNPVRSGWVGGSTGSKLKEWRWSSFPQPAGGRGRTTRRRRGGWCGPLGGW